MPELIFEPSDDKSEDEKTHDQKMADRADGKTDDNPAGGKAAPPDWLPEKYARYNEDGTLNIEESSKALASANAELNKQFTQSRQKDSEGDDKSDAKEGDDKSSDADTDAAKAALGEELFTELSDEFAKTGELSKESREKLHKGGIPDSVIDQYLDGAQASGDKYVAEVTSVLPDGEEGYNNLVDWAQKNLNESEQEVFDEAIQSGNVAKAQMALRDLSNRHTKAEGRTGQLLGGEVTGGDAGYESRAQMISDMKDKRYKTDDAYRAKVERKVGATDFSKFY